ncbi:MAG: sortase [Chloroflexota bacterium]
MGRSRGKRSFRILGAALTLGGVALLLAVAAYYVYAAVAESQLSQLSKSAAAPLNRRTATVAATPTATPTVPSAATPFPSATPVATSTVIPTSTPTLTPTPSPTPTPLPLPPKRIVIPSIGVAAKVVPVGLKWEEGKLVWGTASHAVAHHEGSANPGEPSNIVMSGHISSPLKKEGNVFRRLPEIELGAEVVLYTDTKLFRYKVVETRVIKPEETEVMEPTPYPVLTLITCVPDWVYTHRLIVIAESVGEEELKQ